MSLPAARPVSSRIYTVLIMSLLIWGGTSVIGKVTVESFPIFTTLFLRFCLASLFLCPLFWRDGRREHLDWRSLGTLILLGSFGTTLNIGLFFFGIAQASILDTSIIVALGPLLLSVAGWLFLHEHGSRLNWLGIVLAAFGAIVALTTKAATVHHSISGDLFIVASEAAMVVYTIWSKEVLDKFSPLTIASVSFFASMVAFAPLSAWEYLSRPDAFHFTAGVGWGLLYLGIASSVIAYVAYEWSLEWLPAFQVAALSYLQPLFSVVLAMCVLGETLSGGYMVGGVIAAVGIGLALYQPHLRGRRAKDVLHTRHPHHRS